MDLCKQLVIHKIFLPIDLITTFCCFSLLVPVCWIILFLTKNQYKKPNTIFIYNEKSNEHENVEVTTKVLQHHQQQHHSYRPIKLALCGLALAFESSTEVGWFDFSTTMYQNWSKKPSNGTETGWGSGGSGIQLSASTADHLLALQFMWFAIGRLSTTFITIKLSPEYIIIYHYVIICGSFIAQYCVRGSSQIWIAVTNSALGYGMSAMWPAVLAFTERHLRLSNQICSMYSFLSGICSLIIPLILGQTFNSRPLLLFYLCGIFISISLVIFVIALLWILSSSSSTKTTSSSSSPSRSSLSLTYTKSSFTLGSHVNNTLEHLKETNVAVQIAHNDHKLSLKEQETIKKKSVLLNISS